MQRAISLLLIISLTLQCFSRLGVMAYFKLNQDYIAAVLCINKAKPELGCKGKCYLKKQLKAQQQQEQKTPVGQKQLQEVVLFCQHSNYRFEPLVAGVPVKAHGVYLLVAYDSPLSSLYHPPRA
jgi:hypothetical protein